MISAALPSRLTAEIIAKPHTTLKGCASSKLRWVKSVGCSVAQKPMRLTFALLLCLISQSLLADISRPNILLILADDLGFSDLGCYGSEVPTPHLDALSARGVKFSQFYNAARCCPSRAALLTGHYPHAASMGHMTFSPVKSPGYVGVLNPHTPTIAEALKLAGYRSYLVGKWHVGVTSQREGLAHPLERGFDRFHGTGAGGNFFKPKQLYEDRTAITPGDDFYITDDLNDQASRYLREHVRDHAQQPFFLHLCHTAPHFPLHARPADIARHRGKYRSGWDKLRETRFAKQKQLGLFPADTELPPRDPIAAAWDSLSEDERDMWDMRMATYAAMIEVMDSGLGRVFATLKELDLEKNTVVMFLSDNGSSAEVLDQWPVKGQYSHTPGAICGTAESHLCLEVGWSNAANTPYREHKMFLHQGGIATPFIIAGPGFHGGQWQRDMAHLIDLMPVCMKLGGATYPATCGGKPTRPLPGVNYSVIPDPQVCPAARLLAWEHEGNRAIRIGDWKLVSTYQQPWELYDLATDPTELQDRAKQQPDRVKAMSTQWQSWADDVGVRPWQDLPMFNYQPSKNYRRKSEPVEP
jgi:arylsulfatase A-like enzyme